MLSRVISRAPYRILLVLFAAGCTEPDSSVPDRAPSTAHVVPPPPPPAPRGPAETSTYGAAPHPEPLIEAPETHPPTHMDALTCRKRIDEARSGLAYPGVPRLEAKRGLLLARAKSEPVLFLEEPRFTGAVTKGVAIHRNRLATTPEPRQILLELLKQYNKRPELRQLLLRNGYLYLDDPGTAHELSIRASLEGMFTEPALTLERGSERFAIERDDKGVYRHADGTNKGQKAFILLFDRVWVSGEEPGPSIHVDVRELANRLGFEGMRVDFLGDTWLVADLRFEDEWVPALLSRRGPDLELDCLVIDEVDEARIGRARDHAFRRAAVLRTLRHAIVDQVEAGLPFDEPKTEVGQQDGELRRRWETAYLAGKAKFKFNKDEYDVFDENGVPMTPQVCIDFVTETLEKASGMGFAPRGEPPHKIMGTLDFDVLLEGQRRRESALRQYAAANPNRLAIINFPESDWVRYENTPGFFRFIESHKDDLRAGDIVVIRGRAAWDHYEELHTHTFYIYETDPISGMPILLAGNAGKPRIVTWDVEMARAPRRTIQHRIRPNMEWLYDHVVLREPLQGERWATPIVVYEQ